MSWIVFLHCERKFEIDRLPTYNANEFAIKQMNPGTAPRLDGHALQVLKVKMLSLLYSISSQNEGMDFFYQMVLFMFVCRRAKEKNEFVTITVESFLEAVGNVLSRVLLNRLLPNICPDFRYDRGTTNMKLSARCRATGPTVLGCYRFDKIFSDS